ncbi:MAG: FAS1-like dehydratase domain-containing protein [Acidimicrobiia bacterium]
MSGDRWGVIDERSIAEARELIGVPLRRERMQWNEVATADAIRQFADGVGDDNPLWLDPMYAASTRWGGLLAPPSFLYAVDATIVAPRLPGVQWIYAGTRWRWYDVILVDDVFDVTATFTEMEEKTGRRFGLWVLQTGEIRYRRDDGGMICVAEGRVARTPRQRSAKTKGAKEAPEGNDLDGATQPAPPDRHQPPLGGDTRRSDQTRYWEGVRVGDTIGPVAQPLSLDRIFAWYTGAQGALHYGGAHGDAVRYRRRHDDYEINRETGAKDSAARGHFSSKEGKDVGMGGAYDVGLHRIAWAIELLTDWMGDEGHLAEADIDVLRPNLVGDTTYFTGTVTATWMDDHPFVGIGIEGRNQHDALTTRGSAVVALPSSGYGPVALPLFGGNEERWTKPPLVADTQR